MWHSTTCGLLVQSALHIITTSYPRSACVPYAPHTPGPVAEIGAEMTISEYSTYLYFDLQMNNKWDFCALYTIDKMCITMLMYFERLSWHHARYGHHANICCGTPKPKYWVSYIFDSFWTLTAKESCYRSLVHTLSVIQHTERLPPDLGWRRVSVHTPASAVWNRTDCTCSERIVC